MIGSSGCAVAPGDRSACCGENAGRHKWHTPPSLLPNSHLPFARWADEAAIQGRLGYDRSRQRLIARP